MLSFRFLEQEPEIDGAKPELIAPVRDRLEADEFVSQDGAQDRLAFVPSDDALLVGAPRDEVRRIDRIAGLRGSASIRGDVNAGGFFLFERFVRPLLVVLVAKRSKDFCWAPQLAAIGCMVAALSVRCMRSWRPFCCGRPGTMRSGVMPSLTHQTESFERPPSPLEAKGLPLSVRIRNGNPNSRKLAAKASRTGSVRGSRRASQRNK